MTLREAIENFIENSNAHSGFSKTTVNNLLIGSNSPSVFYSELGDQLDEHIVSSEEFEECVRTAVKSYSSSKTSAIQIFKLLQGYIERSLHCHIAINYPSIDIGNSFERLMFMAKYLQEPAHKIDDLPDVLWINQRTVESDWARLHGDNDPIKICGRTFSIDEAYRRQGAVQFSSTAHPIFLTENLAQVYINLQGLKKMCQNQEAKPFALRTAAEIWQQLSDYAKNRVIFVANSIIPEDIAWFNELDLYITNSFALEKHCHDTNGHGIVIDCLKNGKSCYIEYSSERDGSAKLYKAQKVLQWHGDSIIILSDGKRFEIKTNQILRSAYTIEELL